MVCLVSSAFVLDAHESNRKAVIPSAASTSSPPRLLLYSFGKTHFKYIESYSGISVSNNIFWLNALCFLFIRSFFFIR